MNGFVGFVPFAAIGDGFDDGLPGQRNAGAILVLRQFVGINEFVNWNPLNMPIAIASMGARGAVVIRRIRIIPKARQGVIEEDPKPRRTWHDAL